MSPEEIERAISKIAWGGRYIEVRDYYGRKRFLIVKSLTVRQRNFIDFVYDSALKEAREAGVMPKFDLYTKYKEAGAWTQEDDIALERFDEQLKKLHDLHEASDPKVKKKFAAQISRLEERQRKLRAKRSELMYYSAESYADEQRTMAMIFCATCDEEENRLWNTWDEFMLNIDNVFLNGIFAQLNGSFSVHSLADIRSIARSGSWRFRWAGAKNTGDLFGKPISEFDSEQQSLLYWSQVYDSVYESMDCPSDSIIEDDELLDKWFEDQSRKRKKKEVEEKGDIGGMRMSSKMRGHGEVFIVANPNINPDAPEIEEISSLNTELVRKFKQAEEKRIKDAGTLKETELRKRGDRFSRKIIGASDAVVSGNSFGQAKGGKRAGTILPGGSIS
jgi:hypothetical protein